MIQQPGHVIQVVLDRLGTRFHVGTVGITLPHDLLVDPLIKQLRRHLMMELIIEPAHQPPHFIAVFGTAWHQRRFGMDLFQIFADGGGFSHYLAVYPQHRHLGSWVAAQEISILFPVALFDKLAFDLFLSKAQPYFAAERGKRHVIEFCHDGMRIRYLWISLLLGAKTGLVQLLIATPRLHALFTRAVFCVFGKRRTKGGNPF